jgi:nucleotide-binding universal stress UspA family protein
LLVRASVANAERHSINLFHKILVPLDGSESGEAVLPYIIEMAQKLKSEIMLLSVVEVSERVHTIGGHSFLIEGRA